jgi:protein involved in polysaccharide export with SLBB domain
MTLSDLIDLAGGLDRATKAAELSKRQIVDGRLISKSVIIDLEKVLAGDPRYNTRLDPFDILICNQKTDK